MPAEPLLTIPGRRLIRVLYIQPHTGERIREFKILRAIHGIPKHVGLLTNCGNLFPKER